MENYTFKKGSFIPENTQQTVQPCMLTFSFIFNSECQIFLRNFSCRGENHRKYCFVPTNIPKTIKRQVFVKTTESLQMLILGVVH